MGKISIIIPIYNTGEKLYRCLDSVKSQTYPDFECLMIDDGSTDESPAIIDRYAAEDSRFLAVHKRNGGVSSARNVGLDKAKGEWIFFADSDDLLLPNHLEKMLEAASENIDMVFSGVDTISKEGKVCKGHQYKNASYYGLKEIANFLETTDVLQIMVPWDRMFRRSIIVNEKIQFDEHLSLSEDRLFNYNYLLYVHGIATISDITYRHDKSDMNSLSFRTYPIHINAYRHDVFVEATKKVIVNYPVSGQTALVLWQYVWSLLMLSLSSIYDVKKNIFTTSKEQRKFFKRHFSYELYGLVKHFPEIAKYMSRNENQMILEGHFLKWNFSKLKKYILYKFHISR